MPTQSSLFQLIQHAKNNPPTQQFSIDGKLPVVGGKFWYKSPITGDEIEGEVAHVSYAYIISTKGVKYDLKEVRVESAADLRDEKINQILR